MRVLVDSQALEALCQAAEDKHRVLVAKLRSSVRAEPKAEEVTKVSEYVAESLAVSADAAEYIATEPTLHLPRRRS
jgi:hypothetical protein